VNDYLWRWDTDWFWCSRNFGLDRLWLRRLLGRARLNSSTYTRSATSRSASSLDVPVYEYTITSTLPVPTS
jgi:hypothetical protein